MPSKDHTFIEEASVRYHEDIRFMQRVMEKWLKGYSLASISVSEGNCTISSLTRALNIKREELKESQEATLDLLVAERIGGLRQIQQEAHEYLELLPEKAPQLLTVALRAEEAVAKIQGVLSDKVLHLGRIQHDIKLYDFNDLTPPMIIEGGSITIEEPELPPIQEVAPLDMSKMKEVKVKEVVEAVIAPVAKGITIKTMRGGYVDFE